MKKTLKLLGIIAFVAVIGFSMTACGEEEAGEDITITITGDFSEFVGWEADIGLFDVDTDTAMAVAWLDVKANSSSLPFTMLKADTSLKPFNTPGTYMILLWFEKEGEDDVDYYIVSKSIKEGENTLQFASFTKK